MTNDSLNDQHDTSVTVQSDESKRIEQWLAAANAELQDDITEASKIRSLIDTSKTQAKKQYYQKKFKKVQTRVFQMLTLAEQLKSKEAMMSNTNA
jgi:glutaredoxin 2